jgi:hypothetical protein
MEAGRNAIGDSALHKCVSPLSFRGLPARARSIPARDTFRVRFHPRWNRIAGDAIVRSDRHLRMLVMKIVATLLAITALSLAAQSADAKGCLKGAAVGGVAGHFAGHHGVLGAAAGCLYGRHRANEQERQQERQQQQQSRGGQAPAGQERM